MSKFEPFNCLHCQLAKQTTLSFSKSNSTSHIHFGLVQSETWGPSPTPTVNSYKYFALFIDDCSASRRFIF